MNILLHLCNSSFTVVGTFLPLATQALALCSLGCTQRRPAQLASIANACVSRLVFYQYLRRLSLDRITRNCGLVFRCQSRVVLGIIASRTSPPRLQPLQPAVSFCDTRFFNQLDEYFFAHLLFITYFSFLDRFNPFLHCTLQ